MRHRAATRGARTRIGARSYALASGEGSCFFLAVDQALKAQRGVVGLQVLFYAAAGVHTASDGPDTRTPDKVVEHVDRAERPLGLVLGSQIAVPVSPHALVSDTPVTHHGQWVRKQALHSTT